MGAGGQGSNPPFLQAEPMMAASPVSSGGDVPSPEWETPSDVVVVGVVVRTGGLHHSAAVPCLDIQQVACARGWRASTMRANSSGGITSLD